MGTDPLQSQKSVYNLQAAPFIYTVPPYLQILRNCVSASAGSTNHRSRNTVIFTIEKNPCISGLTQFKPVLFKDQL